MEYTCTAAGWADLPLDPLDGIIARLPFPGDLARFAATCRAWRSATRQLVTYFPWIVRPNGTFYTAGGRGAAAASSFRMPGFPDDTTCLGAAHDCWLALDRTDDVLRRTPSCGMQVVDARPDVNHKHSYMLHNPFRGVTVPLPELDAVIGLVAETFEVRKVLMRSPDADDVIAVTTNNWNCNIVLCRPGKGCFVLDEFRVVDIAFLGDTLYGITSGEELLAFHLGEDEDGRPNVTRIELLIKNPMAKYYDPNACCWFWPEQVVDTSDDHIDGVGDVSSRNEEADPDDGGQFEEEPNNQEEDNTNDIEEENQDEEEENIINEESSDDDDLEDSFNGDGMVSDNEVFDGYADGEVFDRFEQEEPYDAKDELHMGRYLVQSQSGGELLLVRHQWQSCPRSHPYTRKVEVFKVDFSAPKKQWVATSTDVLLATKGEAIFLNRSYSKCTRAHGGIHQGFVYYGAGDVFDTISCTTHNITLWWPEWRCWELTWLFPPELVV